jgi:hypothetical protein
VILGQGMQHVWGGTEKCIHGGQGLKERSYWEDEDINGRIRLKFILKRLWVRVYWNCLAQNRD